ncbi:NACHT domain-containing protein [Streptomyces sp. NPDC053048]|uniref:NACHT domain-containing protein n=1 Tax=Streptomyces sp. NPDC053048 TaxID=3365694 RepID=UPI0037D08B99
MRSVEDRLVAVLGAQQGSGVLLTPRLVLTSAHIFDFAHRLAPHVLVPGGSGPVDCEVLWAGPPERCDAALLWARRDLVPANDLPPLRWGTLAGQQPVGGCQVLGFPQVQRYWGDELEAVQIPGTLTPLSGRLRGRYVLHSDHHPPGASSEGSPWAGLSGGPLFAGPLLLGIATEDPHGWEHSAIDAVPVAHILAEGLAHVLKQYWPDAPDLEEITSPDPRDLAYEEEYARAVKARYSRMEIFGLDDLGTNENSWDLDTAYLSLEAVASADARRPPPEPRRVEELLGSRPRSVLRGEAGAGKTTLVWWLASHAACRTLPAELGALNGLVPFVVPMRSLAAQGITNPTPSQLPTIAQLPVDDPPAGWAGRVLAAERALLLVDGLDELPQADRDPARKWLAQLLRMHPGTRCLVTVRPLAVEQAWLASEGFEELQLLPMSNADIQSFVAAWHRAARLECGAFGDTLWADEERARLTGLERDLAAEFQRNDGLRDLARTPLLCAVICALHRRRRGLLPRTRWHLYQAALTMLLGNRDAHRRVGAPEGIKLTVDDGQHLLQRIAVWLVRNNRAELSRRQAVRQLKLAMDGLRQVREQGTAEAVLTHLLNRSGLLQARTTDSLQFIHRTFQDYLAAKEFQDSDSLDELLGHAADEQWQDVIRLVVGHCGRSEVQRVIAGLNAAGDVERRRTPRWALRTLAAECATSATYLPDDQRRAVWDRVRALGPPEDEVEVEYLASLGPDVLDVLPGPEGLSPTAAQRVVQVLTSLGTAAVPLLRRYGQHPSARVRTHVAAHWHVMDAASYVEEVMAGMRLDDIQLDITRADQLALLPRLGPVGSLFVMGPYPSDELKRALDDRDLRSLTLGGDYRLRDLEFLRGHPKIENLRIFDCSGLTDIEALSALPTLPRLSSVHIDDRRSSGRCVIPPPHPGVHELKLDYSGAGVRLTGIVAWESLRELHVSGILESPGDLGELLALHRLRSLHIWLERMEDLTGVGRLSRVTTLGLKLTKEDTVDARLFLTFPSLRKLHLSTLEARPAVLDLSGLSALPAPLEVWESQGGLTLRGTDHFGGRLMVHSTISTLYE